MGIVLAALMALPAQHCDAQVVPYRVEGNGLGSLLDLTSFGGAKGLPLGRCTFTGDVAGVTTLIAADGSTLRLQRQVITFLDTTDPDPITGLVVTTLIEENAQDGRAIYGLGRVQLAMRDSKQAIESFNQARKLKPELENEIEAIIAPISAQYLEAAKDRIKRQRPGAEKFLLDILPGFPDYEEAQSLLATL